MSHDITHDITHMLANDLLALVWECELPLLFVVRTDH